MGHRTITYGDPATEGVREEAPAFQRGHGLLAEAAVPGVCAVAPARPPLDAAAAEGYSDGTTGILTRLVGPALEAGVANRPDRRRSHGMNIQALIRNLRCSTNRITAIVQAVLVLHHASA
ncbi:hypothetical protein AB0E62_21860 [Streptomyces sp. NPDC038707]|uniref:hypothetical protein n=1 Tax=Streptomyces sp. NPDC038707 TaxID=3154329 RepID=UPI0033C7E273